MLYKHNIICISSIDWDFIWQGHQEIMSVLADSGNRVLFIENTGVRMPTLKDAGRMWSRFLNWKKGYKGIRMIKERLYVYSPLVLPFPYSRISVKINKISMLSIIRRWMKAMEFHDPVVWSFLPTPLTIDILDELDPSLFIYYCIDDFVSSSKGAARIKKIEKRVVKMADLVFTTSHKLYHRCRTLNKETHLFPFGINTANYVEVRDKAIKMPYDMANVKKPIIGYVGGIHKWIDMELVKKIASEKRDASFVLIGPKQTDLCGVDKLNNVFILGKKEPKDLPNYVKFFDVGLIPYKITAYTENVYPTKINEYLVMGKPVISTPIPEVIEINKENGGNFIYFIKGEKDIASVIECALRDNGADAKNKRIEYASDNDWMIRIEKMCALIEKKLEELRVKINKDWQERFKRFYRKGRRNTVRVVGAALAAYLILFYSPFLWFIASPLKIEEMPQKADAIVVFGGGVGEKGSPGKSTIERARLSAELYKDKFSRRIVYSSGYIYKYNDAENMKLIAVSMGVPQEDIILEKEANSTYQNVKNTAQIARRNGFSTIILISSPYNMRRASLVFNRMAKDICVIYVPVPEPEFYHREMPIRGEQIGAIIHEYLGIIYYFIKGYI